MSWGRSCGRGPAVLLGSVGPLQQQKAKEEYDANFIIQAIETNCQLIASQAEHLHRMRSRCATTAQLTQQEIRNVEEKLVKLFSMQLVTKRKLPLGTMVPPELQLYPSLRQWLEVVGLSKDVIEGLSSDIKSLENLLDKDDCELNSLLCKHGSDTWEIVKLIRSVGNLKRYTESQMDGKEEEFTGSLYWDSWEQSGSASSSSFSSLSRGNQRSSVSSSEGEFTSSNPSSPPNLPLHDRRATPPSTPPIILKKAPVERKFLPPTPPPSKKNMLQNTIKQLQTQQQLLQQQIQQQQPSLGRSTSHESQLSQTQRAQQEGIATVNTMDHLAPRRSRLQSDSGAETVMSSDISRSPEGGGFYRDRNVGSCGDFAEESRIIQNSPLSSKLASPTKIPYFNQEDNRGRKFTLRPPTFSGSMVHNVHHRFTSAIKLDKCGLCKQKIPLFGGLKCKECNFKCHKECESRIPASCGLPEQLLAVFTAKVQSESGEIGLIPGFNCRPKMEISNSQLTINNIPTLFTQDSSSNTSSCNSSTPSSPALIMPHSPAHKSSFNYSDMHIMKTLLQQTDIPVDMRPWIQYDKKNAPSPIFSHNVIDSMQSHDSDRTVSTNSGSGSTGTDDSDRTVAGRVDSQDSTVSEGESNDPSRCTRQNSVSSVSQSLREWDIPYDELEIGEAVGRGRFGIVYSGNWHGQVAIKELNMDYVNDEKTLEAFKAEVSTFRKTRHENLVLFMGACMKPPRLAIVTSLCKGMTLYKHIHIRKDKFTMSRTIPIAQQIAQGMGYLHARGIVHKDLKTKNIFLENGKIIITDFGLFNVTRLCYDSRRGDWLSIPPGWLCYLAPEIMRNLRLNPKPDDALPFTTYSDVYSFGTVWYELLCGEWPHKGLHPESVIWQVGRGMKPSLAHLQASRDVKDILMACWTYRADDRQEFSGLLKVLTRLPKKRLARSPSHPIQLSRSAESVF